MTESFDCDALIVGGGAAGMTAALYLVRKKLKTYVVTVDVGGQTNLTTDIQNYPGYTAKSGPELMLLFKKQAEDAGAEFLYGKVAKVEKISGANASGAAPKPGEVQFRSTMANGDVINSKLVILAFGKVARMLNVPGEQKFFGRGVSTCVTCDAPLYSNKRVVVVGGGNTPRAAPPPAVVDQPQRRWVHVGLVGPLRHLGTAQLGSALQQPVVRPACAFTRNGFLQGWIVCVEVVILQRRRLVEDFVRRHQRGVDRIHGGLLVEWHCRRQIRILA